MNCEAATSSLIKRSVIQQHTPDDAIARLAGATRDSDAWSPGCAHRPVIGATTLAFSASPALRALALRQRAPCVRRRRPHHPQEVVLRHRQELFGMERSLGRGQGRHREGREGREGREATLHV